MQQDTLKAVTTHLSLPNEANEAHTGQMNSVHKSTGSQAPHVDTLAVCDTVTTTEVDSTLLFRNYGFFDSTRQADATRPLHFTGISGTPVPYKPGNDTIVVCALLVCLLITSFVVNRNRHAIALQIKNFFHNRSRSESIALKSESNVRHQTYSIVIEGAMLSLIFFSYTWAKFGFDSSTYSPYLILAADIAVILGYFALKYVLLLTFNWTFFTDEKRSLWLSCYNLLVLCKTAMILLLTLAVMFFNLSPEICIYAFLAILAINESMVLFKTHQIFFTCPFGGLLSILYFCTLELLPLLLLWKALIKSTDYLLI